MYKRQHEVIRDIWARLATLKISYLTDRIHCVELLIYDTLQNRFLCCFRGTKGMSLSADDKNMNPVV